MVTFGQFGVLCCKTDLPCVINQALCVCPCVCLSLYLFMYAVCLPFGLLKCKTELAIDRHMSFLCHFGLAARFSQMTHIYLSVCLFIVMVSVWNSYHGDKNSQSLYWVYVGLYGSYSLCGLFHLFFSHFYSFSLVTMDNNLGCYHGNKVYSQLLPLATSKTS